MDVVEGCQQSRGAKRINGEMVVHGSVDGENKGREVHQKSSFLGANESTALLGDVGTKAVEWNCQTWDMQYIADHVRMSDCLQGI